MKNEERVETAKRLGTAAEYIARKMANEKTDNLSNYPLNRGDIMLLIVLIDREMESASSDFTHPLNGKRLNAIREKLGDLAPATPQMTREEAQQFRE